MNLKIVLSEVLSKRVSCMIQFYGTKIHAKSVLEKIRAVVASKAWGQELTRKAWGNFPGSDVLDVLKRV